LTSKERLIAALNREKPDRLPATVHQWQRYHLDKYMGGISDLEAFRHFSLDASLTLMPICENESPQWRRNVQKSSSSNGAVLERITIDTPAGQLTEIIEDVGWTRWTREYLIKKPEDVDLIEAFMPMPGLDHAHIARAYDQLGDDGIMRGLVWGRQPGCWQDACSLYGLENLIMATFDMPDWVHRLLRVLLTKKLQFIDDALAPARYDLIETGGGAASSTCISPELHRQYCLPYDRQLHAALHDAGFKVVYHTCGGMMAILDCIAANGCDASETLTPVGMGGDVDPVAVKARLGSQCALIGGLNQKDVLDRGDGNHIDAEVTRLFDQLGPGGGYIMSPSDHFFETPPASLSRYAEAARRCIY
jgi:uroporphyrinogen-III decarboxylase